MKNYNLFKVVSVIGLVSQVAACHPKKSEPAPMTQPINHNSVAQPIASPPIPPEPWGPVTDGLQAQLHMKKSAFTATEPLELQFTIKNVSAAPLVIEHCGFWCNHEVIIMDSQDHKIEPHAIKEQLAKRLTERVTLQPGQQYSEDYVDFRRYFSMDKPGVYHVEVRYINAGKKFSSNRLTFTLVK